MRDCAGKTKKSVKSIANSSPQIVLEDTFTQFDVTQDNT